MYKDRIVKDLGPVGEATSIIMADILHEEWGRRSRVNIDVTLYDCSKSICWHEFGSTEYEAMEKLDKIIETFQAIKDSASKAFEDKAQYREEGNGDDTEG